MRGRERVREDANRPDFWHQSVVKCECGGVECEVAVSVTLHTSHLPPHTSHLTPLYGSCSVRTLFGVVFPTFTRIGSRSFAAPVYLARPSMFTSVRK